MASLTEAAVKQIVTDVIATQATSEEPVETKQATVTSGEVLYADPYLQGLMEKKLEIMQEPLDIRMVRSKSGVTEVNYTKMRINMINDEINDWRDRKTHNKVR